MFAVCCTICTLFSECTLFLCIKNQNYTSNYVSNIISQNHEYGTSENEFKMLQCQKDILKSLKQESLVSLTSQKIIFISRLKNTFQCCMIIKYKSLGRSRRSRRSTFICLTINSNIYVGDKI